MAVNASEALARKSRRLRDAGAAVVDAIPRSYLLMESLWFGCSKVKD
jgi:hypothetical protein